MTIGQEDLRVKFRDGTVVRVVIPMERIEGTVATAISYAKVIDDRAREQIRRMCSYDVRLEETWYGL